METIAVSTLDVQLRWLWAVLVDPENTFAGIADIAWVALGRQITQTG
jgi:hypothetical protein